MWRCVTAALILLLHVPLVGAPHRYKIYPNPTITIFAMTEGPDGFLWLAAADGLYRFDGMHYHKIPGYPFKTAKFVTTTMDGALWIGGDEGLVRYKDDFRVIRNERVTAMAGLGDHVLISAGWIYSVDLNGALVMRPGTASVSAWAVDRDGRAWFPCLNDEICWENPSTTTFEQVHAGRLPFQRFTQAAVDGSGAIWVSSEDRAARVGTNSDGVIFSRRFSQAVPRGGPLQTGQNGQLWFAGELIRGMSPRIEFRDRTPRDQYLPTAVYEDTLNRLWVAKLGEGLTEWTGDPSWERWFPEDLGNRPAVQVIRTEANEIVAATHDNLYRLDETSRAWRPIARDQRRYAAVLPLKSGEFLASIRDVGLARLALDGRLVEAFSNPVGNADDYRFLLKDRQGRIWVANRTSLLRIEDKSTRVIPVPLPMVRPNYARPDPVVQPKPPSPASAQEQAIDLELDREGKVWVGYADGIAWLDATDQWRRLTTDLPVENVRSFTLAGDRLGSDIWVAHRTGGFISRLRRDGDLWRVTRLGVDAGYGPRDSHFIKRDSRGWIWRGSTDGVHIADGIHFEPHNWIHIGLTNGLATDSTDQYGFFEDADGSVWIAGEDGISHLHPEHAWFEAPRDAPAPKISRVVAGGSIYSKAAPAELPSVSELRIDVGSMHLNQFREAPLRYRLRQVDADWRFSYNGTLLLQNLEKREYTLEVEFAGDGPSQTLIYSFQIGGGTSLLPWFWLLSFPTAGGLLALGVRRSRWAVKLTYYLAKSWFVIRRVVSRQSASKSPDLFAQSRDLSGQTLLSRYHLVSPVARSGFSVVYEAIDLHGESARVAVKVLNATAADNWVRDRFAQEVMALQTVRHPGVVPVLNSWIGSKGEPCLAMPYLEGPTLRAELQSGPFRAARVARLTRRLGVALAQVHERGIVHRDLKPENIILLENNTESEQPVLIDFGAAGLRAAETELAATSLLAGSFYYLAPERLAGQYSAATDVYALGIIVLEMLTGKRLAELNVMFSDANFLSALAGTVEPSVGAAAAPAVAETLASSYDPIPHNRPGAGAWADRLATLLESLHP